MLDPTGPDAATGRTGRRALHRGQSPFAIALLAFVGFALVLLLVGLGDTMRLDLWVTRTLQRPDNGLALAVMQAISWFGFEPQSAIIELGIATFLLLRRLRLEAAFALLAIISSFSYTLIKVLVQRPRPVAGIDGIIIHGEASGYSFPSGHVLNYVVFGGFLIYLAHTLLRSRLVRNAILAVLMALIILVGPSRIYLGQHWFTDILGSYLLGTTILIAILALYRVTKARQVGDTPSAALPLRQR